jgi:uncharacterized protein (UPF0212 family)
MDCRVVLEAAVEVYDVSAPEEAIRIAIAKTGEMLNPDLSHVEIDTGERTSPGGEALEPVFVVADEALVALELEMTVFAVDRTEHAERVARKEIGQRLENVPLSILTVEDVTDETDESSPAGSHGADEGPAGDGAAVDDDGTGEGGASTDTDAGGDGADRQPGDDHGDGSDERARETDDVLPEFEELL